MIEVANDRPRTVAPIRAEFGFRQNGYLWLYADADLYERALEKRALQNSLGLCRFGMFRAVKSDSVAQSRETARSQVVKA